MSDEADMRDGADDLESAPLLSSHDCECDGFVETVPDLGGNDVVQFSTPIYYFDERDDVYSIDIIRLGTMRGRVAVTLVTKNGSAKSPTHYEHFCEQLVFEEREHTRTIEIKASHGKRGCWNPTREFKLSLVDHKNCHVGTYLHDCRVKIFDSACFPSEDVKSHVRKGEEAINQISNLKLFQEYCKLNFRMAGVRGKTILVVGVDLLMNLFIFLSLWVSVYMVDTIFDPSPQAKRDLLLPDRYHTACVISTCFLVPTCLLYGWDLCKTWIDIQGASVGFMRHAMMGAYLDFTADSRQVVTPATLSHAIADCAHSVSIGYVAVMNIIRLVGRILVIAVFLFLFFKDPLTLTMAFVMIVTLIAFAGFRANHLQNLQHRFDDKYLIMETIVGEVSHKYSLVHSYSKTPVMHDMFNHSVDKLMKEKIPVSVSGISTYYITRFLSGIFIAAYIIVKTPAVLANQLSLGVFLATITLFSTTLTDTISELNLEILNVIQSFAPLKDLTQYMNMETILPQIKHITNVRNQRTKLSRQCTFEELDDKEDEAFRTDHIKIAVTKLGYEYIGGHPVLHDVNLAIPQGKMISVTGDAKSGKTTFMELLAHSRCPTSGSIMVPSHLRLLHLRQEPMFLRASIFSNLCLGLPAREAVDLDRIFTILQMCGLPEVIDTVKKEVHYGHDDEHHVIVTDHHLDVEQDLDKDKDDAQYADLAPTSPDGSARSSRRTWMNEGIKFEKKKKGRAKWETFLTSSQKFRLYMCCALISNPNVMLMMRTLDTLHEENASEIIDVLRQHVKNRGLCLSEESINSRRPRIVCYSTERSELAKRADTILRVNLDKTISEIGKSELSDESSRTPRISAEE